MSYISGAIFITNDAACDETVSHKLIAISGIEAPQLELVYVAASSSQMHMYL